MNAPYKERPGFTRVIMPNHPNKPGKTTRIRTKLANDPNYLAKNGMMLMPTPVSPVIEPPTVQTPAPVTEPTKPVTPPTPKAEPMKPTKVKI